MVTLATTNASVELGTRRVLHDVSIAAHVGQVLVIVGPNGAGKSTLLKVMSGELAPAAGDVSLAGEPVYGMSHGDLARRRALMPQHAGLSFPFTVRDVVAMGRAPFQADRTPMADEDAVTWAMAATDISAFAARPYTRLSGGEQQRVHLARVLAQVWRPDGETSPRFLLLDEPTSSLDLAHQHATLHLAASLAASGVGVVAVVHDLNLAALYADRVAVISAGRLAALGAPDDVLEPELISSVFGLNVRRVPDAASGRHLILPLGHSAAQETTARLAAAQ